MIISVATVAKRHVCRDGAICVQTMELERMNIALTASQRSKIFKTGA